MLPSAVSAGQIPEGREGGGGVPAAVERQCGREAMCPIGLLESSKLWLLYNS